MELGSAQLQELHHQLHPEHLHCYWEASYSTEKELKPFSPSPTHLPLKEHSVVGKKRRGYWPDTESLSFTQHIASVSRRKPYSEISFTIILWVTDWKCLKQFSTKRHNRDLIYHCEVFNRGKRAFLKMTARKLFFKSAKSGFWKATLGKNRAAK